MRLSSSSSYLIGFPGGSDGKESVGEGTWPQDPGLWDPYGSETEVATHSSILAERTLLTEEPGGLLSMGLHRVGHD